MPARPYRKATTPPITTFCYDCKKPCLTLYCDACAPPAHRWMGLQAGASADRWRAARSSRIVHGDGYTAGQSDEF